MYYLPQRASAGLYGVSQMVSVQSEYQLDANALSEAWKAENWLNFNENSVITAVKMVKTKSKMR